MTGLVPAMASGVVVATSVQAWTERVNVVWCGRPELAVLLGVAVLVDRETMTVELDREPLLALMRRAHVRAHRLRMLVDQVVGAGFLYHSGPAAGGQRAGIGHGWGIVTLTVPLDGGAAA